MTTPLLAQSRADRSYLEIAVIYDAMRSDGNSFWMHDGGVQVHGQFHRGLGIAADIAGEHAGNIHSSGKDLDLVTATFGLDILVFIASPAFRLWTGTRWRGQWLSRHISIRF
jgi:hypothetical protein